MNTNSIRTSALVIALLAGTCGAAPARLPRPEDPKVSAPASSPQAAWNEVLSKHVKKDGFDYKGLKADRGKLDAYIAALEAVKPEDFAKWSAREQFAFWINAYNAYTIRLVVDAYPIASIKDLGDEKLAVWDREIVPLGAHAPDLKKPKLSLNDIEHKILRPKFKDPRVHAAVNCASQGCPPLRNEAFEAARLDAQLDEQVKRWLADPARNRFDKSKGLLEVSSIFDWFKDDFVAAAGSVQAWIARYLPEHKDWLDTKKKYDVKFLDYSWKLNDAQ